MTVIRSPWRIAMASVMTLCGAAGAGLLMAAATMQPPRPPQPTAAVATTQPPEPTPTASPKPPQSLPRAEPVKIEIPAIKVNADLLSLGVNDKGELLVPPFDKAQMASWYNLGPSPGEPGSAVIVGHVDSEKLGPAVFFNLGKLKPGDEIKVHRKDGTIAQFKVDAVKSFLKAEFPTEVAYEAGEQAMLKIITCGGEYDKKNKNYLSNIVAFATYAPLASHKE